MLGVLGLSPATKPFFCGNRRAGGAQGAVGRRAGDSQVPLLAASIPFPCSLCEACRKGDCWAVHTATGRGEQLRGKTAGYVSSPNGLDEGQETDRRHGFVDGGWRLKSFPHWTTAWLEATEAHPTSLAFPDCLTACGVFGSRWILKKPSSVYVGIASADEISAHFYHVQKPQVSLFLMVLENVWPCQWLMLCGHFKQLKTPFWPQTPMECGSPLSVTMTA